MGIYPVDCTCCGKPFFWFSGGNYEQICAECVQEIEDREKEQRPETD